jgi:small-conductance mechanosensitive channel
VNKFWQRVIKTVLLAAAIAVYLLPERPAWLPGSGDTVYILLRFAIFFLALDLLLGLSIGIYRRRKGLAPGANDTMIFGLRNLYYLALAGGLFMAILRVYDVDFGTLFTTLSIVAAAIAIVTREFIAEIISGFFLSFSGQLSVGDFISTGENKGKIIDLTLTKVALLNEDDDIIYLPNSKVFGGELINYTQRMQRRVSIEFEVGFSSIRSVDQLEEELIASLVEFRPNIVEQSFNLRIVQLKKDGIDLKFQYTLREANRQLEREIRRKTVRRVVDYVKEIGSRTAGPP